MKVKEKQNKKGRVYTILSAREFNAIKSWSNATIREQEKVKEELSDESKHNIKGLHYLMRTERDGKAIANGEQVGIWKAVVLACLRMTSLHLVGKTDDRN
jgi:peptide deformylase